MVDFRRINPFDLTATDVIGALDEAIDNAAFTESFLVRFLGSMEVKQDRGEAFWKTRRNIEETDFNFIIH